MSGDYTALTTAWQALPAAMTTIQKLSAINTSLVPGPSKDVNRADIKTVLVSNGAYNAMKAYVANPGGANQQALIACNYLLAIVDYEPGTVGPVLATSNPTNLATINALLPGLTADPNTGVTPATINALASLITPLVPWWQMHGFVMPVTVADLAAAGNLF
jgi:hypothetical protein